MTQVTRIHQSKRPVRIHYIAEWAAKRNLKQADIVRELKPAGRNGEPVNKSTVSRWFNGTLPSEPQLLALAELFATDVPSLFRDPEEDWIARLLSGRTEDERKRIAQMIELFPRSTGTAG